MNSNSQAAQDIFVLKCLKNKTEGTFVEIGSHDPILINNTYLLEKTYNWRGIMVEIDKSFKDLYNTHRPNSHHILEDATTVDYKSEFEAFNMPHNIDYLQIDLEVSNNSTLMTLEKLNEQVMDTYKFATVTFEHDIYTGDHFNTRNKSREIFENRGYIRVFSDVSNGHNPYEDWYVHPDLVDMEYINKIKSNEQMEWTKILNIL